MRVGESRVIFGNIIKQIRTTWSGHEMRDSDVLC